GTYLTPCRTHVTRVRGRRSVVTVVARTGAAIHRGERPNVSSESSTPGEVRATSARSLADTDVANPHVVRVCGGIMSATLAQLLDREPLFAGLELAEGREGLAEWLPLMMEGRRPGEMVAATRSVAGTDVTFGALTRLMVEDASARGVHVHCNSRVQRITRET